MNTNWNIREKTVLVTGGTGGIGYETARGLAALGATVIIVGRNASRGATAVENIQKQTGNTTSSFVQADLSSLDEIRRLAEHITTHYPQLQILINNVGARYAQREETVNGLEATLATTHLSSFLLTNLLLPLLEANAPARIVNVNSLTHRSAQINFDDFQSQQNYKDLPAYAQAKLANLLTSYELARRLDGTQIHVNVADPLGAVDTDMVAKGESSRRLRDRVRLSLLSIILTSKRAARSSIYLASSPDVEKFTGKYVNSRCNIVDSSPASYDEATAEKVWRISAELTGMEQKSMSL
jgi:NAD(P)-dependent dehydrogenase (short-subunit alcohol dehydrogenase family)